MKQTYRTAMSSVVLLLAVFMLYACEDASSDSESIPELGSVLATWREETSVIPKSTDGTAISTVAEFKDMTSDGTYYLTAHIDLRNEAWTPLHGRSVPFTGTLRGNGYIVYNLKINAPDKECQGLFGVLQDAIVDNLGIGVGSIKAKAFVGGMACEVRGDGSQLTNIAVAPMTAASKIVAVGTGSESKSDRSYVGGVVGLLSAGDLANGLNDGLAVRATGTTGKHGAIGGLVGSSAGQVTGASSATVSSESGHYVGGLVGESAGQVTGSSNATVRSESGWFVGGLVGKNTGQVTGSMSGEVSGPSGNVGGLAGSNIKGTVKGFSSATIKVTRNNSIASVGGLVGNNDGRVIGVAIGWVMAESVSEDKDIGVVVGYSKRTEDQDIYAIYYNKAGGDHVGTICAESTKQINGGDHGATGGRGTNGLGTGIEGIARVSVAYMSLLKRGAAVGEWTFTAGQWPRINLPDGVTDFVDYATSPPQPNNFYD